MTIVNNTVAHCKNGFMFMGTERPDLAPGGMRNALIAHNTFIDSTAVTFLIKESSETSLRAFNNLSRSSVGAVYLEDVNKDGVPGVVFDFNVWVGDAPIWKDAIGEHDVHAGDAGFVAGTQDQMIESYLLAPDSPALNMGCYSDADFVGTALENDPNGVSRIPSDTNPAPDAGACEFKDLSSSCTATAGYPALF